MPIHLAPISRRRFLRRTIAAGALLTLQPWMLAAKGTDGHTWALLSDPHLAADRSLRARGVNMTDNFIKVSDELVSQANVPAGVIINGDCAYEAGENGDYANLANLLKPIRKAGMPIHLSLGNHDNRERFWDAFEQEKAAPRPVVDRQVALLEMPYANWFMLDSLERTASTPGQLGREQLDWLAKTLDQHPGKPALVMVHHNCGMEGNLGLRDSVAFFEVIRPRRQVKAYIFGHTHFWKLEQETSGIHLVNLPPVGYVFQPGKPSGWVKATIASEGMKLELRCVDTSHKDHGQTVSLVWRS